MIVTYRKTDHRAMSTSGINSAGDPPGSWEIQTNVVLNFGGLPESYGFYQVTDAQAREIYAAASFELTFDIAGNPTGYKVYPRIAVTADKSQILANGVDAATITAQVADTASTESLAFVIDGDEAGAVPVQSAAGKATLIYKTTKFGRHIIEVRSSTKYGRNMVEVTAT